MRAEYVCACPLSACTVQYITHMQCSCARACVCIIEYRIPGPQKQHHVERGRETQQVDRRPPIPPRQKRSPPSRVQPTAKQTWLRTHAGFSMAATMHPTDAVEDSGLQCTHRTGGRSLPGAWPADEWGGLGAWRGNSLDLGWSGLGPRRRALGLGGVIITYYCLCLADVDQVQYLLG